MSTRPSPNTTPTARDWRTTDEQEIARRRERARSESFSIRNLTPDHPVYANFAVRSASGAEYRVEVRNPRDGHYACTCPDFRINGLGTCKHVEAVRLELEQHVTRAWQKALEQGHGRIEIVPDRIAGNLRLEAGRHRLPKNLALMFDDLDLLRGFTPEEALETLRTEGGADLRISQEVEPWLVELQETRARMALRRDYEERVRAGDWPAQETRRALRPHERQGMLHLAFTQRALLADEFCVDKATQAVAACALLYRLDRASRVAVVAPQSRVESWQQLCREVLGDSATIIDALPRETPGRDRLTIFVTSYDQIIAEAEAVNRQFAPDVVVLDEAQRMRNWTSPSALAVKKLQSPFAFVLADTEFENRLDELYAVMDFVAPDVLGPLFRFNRNFYVLNDEGRPVAAKNLEALRARLQPVLLRRERRTVEAELPEQAWRACLCPMDVAGQEAFMEERARFGQLLSEGAGANRLRAAGERLGRIANGLENTSGALPGKLQELRAILPQLLVSPENHVAVFGQWETALQQVRDLCEDLGMQVAWLGGTGSPRSRSVQITKFKADPECRVLLALDAAADGLNLQNCSYLVHLDVPAQRVTLENRTAAVWRRDVCPPLAHVLLAAENTQEQAAAQHLETAGGTGVWPGWAELLDLEAAGKDQPREKPAVDGNLQNFKRTLRRRARDEMGIDPGELALWQLNDREVLLVEVAPNIAENLDNIQQWLEDFLARTRAKGGDTPEQLLAVSRRQKRALLEPPQ